ncbi:MAG: putative lipid II flippase FtsW [Methylococcales bacterium]|nr:putative lipid II flippase FtsW [Methylococcales bacterium]
MTKPFLDTRLLWSSGLLIALGFLMVVSASMHLGDKLPASALSYPQRQALHLLLAAVASTVIMTMPLALWQRLARPMLIGSIALLALVLIPGLGVEVNGSRRWLAVPGLRIQVSELAKLASIFYLASFIATYKAELGRHMAVTLWPLRWFVPIMFLLLMEPDFGSAVVIMFIMLGLLFLAGAQWQLFVGLLLAGSAGAASLVYFSPYRWQRVVSFLDPWADAQASGFQLVQALIAFGRGEITGVGLGSGVQKLFYLPEAHTDFLLSVLAEELGLLGVTLVIGLFAVLIWRALLIAQKALRQDMLFAGYLAYGVALWFFFQAFVNIGVNMGILPTKGLTLPLMSYGGGSMIVMCSALALLQRVHHETVQQIHAQPEIGRIRWPRQL